MAIRAKGLKWQVDVTWKGTRAPRVSVDTYAEAERLEAEFKAALMAGRMPEAPSQSRSVATYKTSTGTLGQLADYAVAHHWRGKKSADSSARNAYAWVDELGADFPNAKLNLQVVDQVTAKWSATVKTGTINRKIAALSVMLQIAREQGALTNAFRVKQQREYNGRIRWVAPDELASMMAFFVGEQDMQNLVTLAVDTGFRYGELIGVTPRDFNVSTGKLATWVTKGDTPRSVPLTPRAREVVLRRRQNVRDWEPIFPRTLNSRKAQERGCNSRSDTVSDTGT